jgi:hypothetical protein
MHCKKMHEVRVEQKRAQETKTILVARWETTWLTAAFTGRGVQQENLKLGCVVCQKFLQKQVAGGSINPNNKRNQCPP